MSDIARRLRASVNMDAVHGERFERETCNKQMGEAATKIENLERALDASRINVMSGQNRICLLEWLLSRWYMDAMEFRDKPISYHSLIAECGKALGVTSAEECRNKYPRKRDTPDAVLQPNQEYIPGGV
jgi:hypothetical protein